MQGQRQGGYPSPKAEEHWEFRGTRLFNNSVFLVRLEVCSPPLPRAEGSGREIKNTGKNHTQVRCPVPRGARKGSRCQLAVPPCRWGVYGNRDHPVPLWPQGQRGTTAEPPRQPLCQGHCSGGGKLSQRGPFVLAYGCGDEWKSMGLFILIKSRGHLRRNRLSEKGTSKGKCVVRKFMDFSICKAEVCSLFMFVLLLKLFMGHFKNPQKSSHRSGIICALITQLNLSSWLMGQPLEPRGQLLSWLTATWLHPPRH